LVKVFLGLGSNQGNRELNLVKSIDFLREMEGIEVLNISSVYITEPWGVKDQPDFLNLVLQISTKLSAKELLKGCMNIEKSVGREKTYKWGPRIIDIDILMYGDEIISEQDLILPHAFLTERRFELVPLAEICPNCVIPGKNVTVKDALLSCMDKSSVKLHSTQL